MGNALLAIRPEPLGLATARRSPPLAVKAAMGAAAVVALVTVVAVQRSPSAEPKQARIVTAPVKVLTAPVRFDDAWGDIATHALKKADAEVPVRQIAIIKTDEPRVVKTERVLPPAAMPPVMRVEAEDEVRQVKRVRYAGGGGDVCSRHKMRKVMTRGGKSWRCRR